MLLNKVPKSLRNGWTFKTQLNINNSLTTKLIPKPKLLWYLDQLKLGKAL